MLKAGARSLLSFGALAAVVFVVGFALAFHATRPDSHSERIDGTLQQVARWQLDHIADAPPLDAGETGWVQAAFYIGLARFAAATDDTRYFDTIRDLGERNRWRLGKRLYHADDHAIAQVYVAAFDRFDGSRMIVPMLSQFDRILATRPRVGLAFDQPEPCHLRWCWCDALFMAPASWMAASRITGDTRYRDFADEEFWATKEFLYDPREHLFFRDSRFFHQRGERGEKIFWGRGNGWVFAGLINILRELPRDHPSRSRYETLFREMADKLLTRQRPDGFWITSLMSPLDSGSAESSSTAFFTYGLASGVMLGLLDRAQFEPAALRGWSALADAVDSNGRLGRVQQIADRPDAVRPDQTQLYGSGALLLAGTAVRRMIDLGR